MATLSSTYFDVGGANVQLRRRLAARAEANIFALADDPSRAATIYKEREPDREARLRAMIANMPPDATLYSPHAFICWPEALIFTGDQEVSGFVMPRVQLSESSPLLYFCDRLLRRRLSSRVTWPYFIRIAINLCGIMEALHSQGHIIGDITTENLCVSENAQVTLADCESIQVQDNATGLRYATAMGSAAFSAPELQDQSGVIERELHHDYFLLAVAVFTLLMEGAHPFDGVWHGSGDPPTLAENIKEGRFPYANSGLLRPSSAAPSYEILPPFIRSLFQRCFVAGHQSPTARPNAWDWHHALQQLDTQLQVCTSNPHHLYSNHLARCPRCNAAGERTKSNSAASAQSKLIVAARTPGAYRTKGSSSIFVPSASARVRWMMPPQSSFGFDMLMVISVALIAGVITLFALGGVPSTRVAALTLMDTLRDRVVDIVAPSKFRPASLPDPLTALASAAGSIRFDPLVLCQGIDDAQNPIGATASFSASDIRAKGIAVFFRFASTASSKPKVEIKWASPAYSGSSRLRSLPSSGAPFFLQLGKSFPPGIYQFSLVVDGIAKQSTNITINP